MKMRVMMIEGEGDAATLGRMIGEALEPQPPFDAEVAANQQRAAKIRADADERWKRLRAATKGPAKQFKL